MPNSCRERFIKPQPTGKMALRLAVILAMLALCLPFNAWAQDQATIVGAVVDTSGAVVPGANVNVANPDKGFVRDLVTNSAGEYIAAKIPIGKYVITVQASGFQKLVRTGIELSVGQTVRVDLQLTLGQMTQEVTVSGSAAKVETENAVVSDVVTGTQILDLNLNGRNYQALAILTPGAAPSNSMDSTHVGHNAQASISFNGSRSNFNNFEVDGGQNNDTSSGGPSPDTFPNLDSIAEFRISTSNYGADVGMRAGANVQLVTKSGTKDFHGDLYEFVRNDHLNANDFFVNQQRWDGLDVNADCGGSATGPCNAPKNPMRRNDFGYTFGGPFYIPGVYNTSKSKTFFFWSQSWAKYREGTVISGKAPTARMRNGDFSECDPSSANYNAVAASGCVLPTVGGATVDSLTGAGYTLDANGLAMLNGYVPYPNNGTLGYVSAPNTPTNFRQEQIRVDQNVSDKTAVFVRFTQDTWTQDLIPALWSGSSYDSIVSPWGVPSKNAVIHLTHTFRPNLLNEVIVGYGNDVHFIRTKAGPGSPAGSILKPSDWSVASIFPVNKSIQVLPGVSVGGGTPFSFYDDAVYDYNYNSTLPTVTFKDNLVYTLGRHTLKTGVFFLNYKDHSVLNYNDAQGSFSFTGGGSVTTGNALADMFLGRIASYTEGTPYDYTTGTALGGVGEEYGLWRQLETYFQDDWKVNRKVTLNLGVRYTLNFNYHYTNTNPVINNDFVPSQYSLSKAQQIDINGYLIPGTGQDYTSTGNGLVICGQGGIPEACINNDYNTIAPRIGFAIDPTGSGKTAIRGGFGVYHDLSAGIDVSMNAVLGGPPSVLAPTGNNIDGYSNIVAGPLATTSISAIPTSGSRIPLVSQYNVTVQHEFRGNNFASLGWVGNQSRHLSRSRNINMVPFNAGTMNVPVLAGTDGCDASGNCNVQTNLIHELQPSIYFVPYRDFGSISYAEYSGVSGYNGLQANFRHSTGYGLTFQTSYTWSHLIDDTDGGSTGVNDYDLSRWRATGAFNRTHVLVMNYVYDLPFFKHNTNALVKNSLGGWQISGITSFFSGPPVDFTCGENGMHSGLGGGMRCNTVGDLKIKKGTTNDPSYGPVSTWFDPGVIAQPYLSQYTADGAAGMFGYMGRNVLTGPGRNNWDLALLKNFQAPWFNGEHSTFQFRFETFNSFNHTQWKGINAGCSGATLFGGTCNDENNIGNGEVTSAWAPRLLQFGLKFIF